METFSQYTDFLTMGSDSGSTGDTPRGNNCSDEEVMLASSNPKKRAGRTKFKETRHPVFRGVRERKNNRWVCEVRVPNKTTRIWLGTYPTAEMAARAHDVAALALRGSKACLNFADSAWRLPVPVSKATSDIQNAAVAAAEAFRPQGLHRTSIDISVENVKMEQENLYYMDDEAMFDMPGLLVDMAEGLMLSPPPCLENSFSWDDMGGGDMDVSLWSYAM